MARRKIIYNNWIAENGVDPKLPQVRSVEDELFISIDDLAESLVDSATPDKYEIEISELRDAVRSAVAKLNEEERELVERVYFLGMTLQELADKSGRRRHSLEALNRRCRKKLIRHLS
jgi:RNA polymerase sigma factor (sigma-70 family)